MSLTEEDVKRWYDRAKRWGRAISAETCKDTLECVHDLSSFLKRLEKDLSEKVGNFSLHFLRTFFRDPLLKVIRKLLRLSARMFFFLSFANR